MPGGKSCGNWFRAPVSSYVCGNLHSFHAMSSGLFYSKARWFGLPRLQSMEVMLWVCSTDEVRHECVRCNSKTVSFKGYARQLTLN